jgi:hypothetical protein
MPVLPLLARWEAKGKMTSKRELISFKKGDQLISPKFGYVTIKGVRGYASKKEFMIVVDGEEKWYPAQQIVGSLGCE